MARNLTMITDFYEFTMAQAYFDAGKQDEIAVFDAFFRKTPLNSGYALMGGLDKIMEFFKNFYFTKEDIEYLRSTKMFKKNFLEYLETLRFTGSIYAIPDGTPVFGNEPLVTIKAPIIEAQLAETVLLSILNSNILYMTAAKRIVEAAAPLKVMEFGARRALGPDTAVDASKCAVIAGCVGTSNTEAGKEYDIPVMGTMAHSFVTSFDSEYEAFLAYAKAYPENSVFLIDTYNVLKSGVINAIKVAKDYLIPNGYRLKGIRIDSGDLAYLSIKVREMLDEAGLYDATICVSNGLKESTIKSLMEQGAPINSIGLGDNIVLPEAPQVGCVYKNVAIQKGKKFVSKIKASEEEIKAINPGYKKPYRIYDANTGYAIGDVLALYNENIPTDKYTLIDPHNESNTKDIENYKVRPLQEVICEDGVYVYKQLDVNDIKVYCDGQMERLYPEVKRMENPQKYYVDLTRKLLNLKKKLILQAKTQQVEYNSENDVLKKTLR